jgi:transposase
MSKRRQFTAEYKARMVLEELTGIKDRAEICREHRLSPQVLARWREEFLERASEIFATTASRGDEQARIGELERMVGRLTVELDAAKKASDILTSLSNGKGR